VVDYVDGNLHVEYLCTFADELVQTEKCRKTMNMWDKLYLVQEDHEDCKMLCRKAMHMSSKHLVPSMIVAEELAKKGFTVRQLLHFYMQKKISRDKSTAHVVRDIIIPETAEHQTCYMESAFMKGHGGPQRAKKLVSHAWKSSFMNTVLNILLDASGLTVQDMEEKCM